MITKSDLNYLRYLSTEIKEKEAQLLAIYIFLEGRSSRVFTDEPPGGPSFDRFLMFEKISDKKEEINRLCAELKAEKDRIIPHLESLTKAERKLIEMRYFHNLSWKKIIKFSQQSLSALKRLHLSALSKLK